MDNVNIGSLIADQYKDTEAASTQEEAMTGNRSELDYSEDPKEETQDEVQEEVQAEAEEENQETVEEPTGESTDSNSSLNNEETQNTEESESDAVEPTFDFNAEISKRTDGKYESFEDLIASTEKPVVEHEYGNELIAKLDELAKQGVSIDLDFIKAQTMDYTKYDLENVDQSMKLIEMELKLDEPDITQREIDFELSEKYKLDEDVYDESDIERSKLRLMRDAKKARIKLEDNQKNLAVPKGGVDPEKQRQAEEQARLNQERLAKTLTESVKSYEKEVLSIGDEKFDYKLSDATKKNLENVMLNTDKFFHKYIDKDGKIDTNKLRSDMLWLTDRDNMLKSYLSQATSKGSKDVVAGIKNTSFDGKAGAKTSTDYSLSGAIAKHFTNKK